MSNPVDRPALVEKVALALYEADPIGIRDGGSDEYAPEADAIVSRSDHVVDAADLTRVMYSVFVEMFGAELAGSFVDYEDIADVVVDDVVGFYHDRV